MVTLKFAWKIKKSVMEALKFAWKLWLIWFDFHLIIIVPKFNTDSIIVFYIKEATNAPRTASRSLKWQFEKNLFFNW